MIDALYDPRRPSAVDTPRWVRDAVFYQIFPDRFASSTRVRKPARLEPWDSPPTTYGFKGGDLLGIVERLDELAELGVNALYLTPIFSSASNHRYHTYDYLEVDPLLGGDAALRELLDACHGRGMRVVLDGVFNHASRGFWPFHHVMETGAGSPYRDWFHYDQEALDRGVPLRAYPVPGDEAGGGYDRTRDSLHRLGYRAWWDLPALPKLNTDNPDVREYLFGVAEHWLRFGIDGWRLDVPGEIDDEAFWQEFRRRVRAVNPEAYIVGEIWREAPEWLRGDRFDALMNYPLTEAILSYVGAGRLDAALVSRQHEYREHVRATDGAGFLERLERTLTVYDPAVTAVQLNLLGSHDTPRFLTVASGDRSALRLATLIQMTLPGAPCIYYGDELGMEGGQDPDCRRSYPRVPDAQGVEMRDLVAAATRLRHGTRAFRDGAYRSLGARGYASAYARWDEESWIAVVVNAADEAVELAVRAPEVAGRRLSLQSWTTTPQGAGEIEVGTEGVIALPLPARSALVAVATD